jgi:hypothetical protein
LENFMAEIATERRDGRFYFLQGARRRPLSVA